MKKEKSVDVTHINIQGKILNPLCEHKLIPGLDASFCETCNIYYRDEKETYKFYQRKKRIHD
jgi:hypothetical protein